MEHKRRQSWSDKHGIREIVRASPKLPVEIVKILKTRDVPDSTGYQQITQGVDEGGVKRLDDGRIASLDYSPTQDAVELAILRIIDRQSLGGFLTDASVPGYAIGLVAQDLGIKPGEIESDFYAVMRKLRNIAEEVGMDKKLFLEKLGGGSPRARTLSMAGHHR